MTRVALELFVLGNAVRELFEGPVRRANGDRFGCFGRGDEYRGLLRLLDTACRKCAKSAQD